MPDIFWLLLYIALGLAVFAVLIVNQQHRLAHDQLLQDDDQIGVQDLPLVLIIWWAIVAVFLFILLVRLLSHRN